MKSITLLLSFIAVFTSCTADRESKTAQSPALIAKSDTTSLAQIVRGIDAAANELALETGAVEAIGSILAEDVIYIAEGRRPIQGRENLMQAMLDTWAEEYNLQRTPIYIEVASAGDMAYVSGEWELFHISDPTRTPVSFGNYLDIYKNFGGNDWKITFGMGNKYDPKSQIEMYRLLNGKREKGRVKE